MTHTLWINIDWITIYAADIFPSCSETKEGKREKKNTTTAATATTKTGENVYARSYVCAI